MTNNIEETDDQENQQSRPIQEWSDEELREALIEVRNKFLGDWSNKEFQLIWEDSRRKREERRSQFQALQDKEESSLEEWIKFLTEIALDIYSVEKDIQYTTLSVEYRILDVKKRITDVRRNLHIVNENIISIPTPPPPTYCQYDRVRDVVSPDSFRLNKIEEMLENILRRI